MYYSITIFVRLCQALNAVYPHLDLNRPHIKPAGYWTDKANQKKFFDQLAQTLNIKRPEDWYFVTLRTVTEHGGSFINSHYNGSLIRGTMVLCHDVN
jgi:hypothetical protein